MLNHNAKVWWGQPTTTISIKFQLGDETWEKKFSLEIGCSQGLVYGFTRYDDNHEKANKLISFLGKKLDFEFYEVNSWHITWKFLKISFWEGIYFAEFEWAGLICDINSKTSPTKKVKAMR